MRISNGIDIDHREQPDDPMIETISALLLRITLSPSSI
jgi:hypothetical protein